MFHIQSDSHRIYHFLLKPTLLKHQNYDRAVNKELLLGELCCVQTHSCKYILILGTYLPFKGAWHHIQNGPNEIQKYISLGVFSLLIIFLVI